MKHTTTGVYREDGRTTRSRFRFVPVMDALLWLGADSDPVRNTPPGVDLWSVSASLREPLAQVLEGLWGGNLQGLDQAIRCLLHRPPQGFLWLICGMSFQDESAAVVASTISVQWLDLP